MCVVHDHHVCIEVKGQFGEVSSLHHVGPRAGTQVFLTYYAVLTSP